MNGLEKTGEATGNQAFAAADKDANNQSDPSLPETRLKLRWLLTSHSNAAFIHSILILSCLG